MQTYIKRKIHNEVAKALSFFPAVAILGPRQCGKSTLAHKIIETLKNSLFLDLERESDLRKLTEPELFLSKHSDKLVCLDEIQRKPDLFSTLRVLIDEDRRNGRFLILGSASRELLRQSSETLAGRICYLELTPFLLLELEKDKSKNYDIFKLLLNGGFPESILAETNEKSLLWRENFIRTFLERDIQLFGFNISSTTMLKLWKMIAHTHGQTLNYSKLASSLGITSPTVKNYIEILAETYMLRIMPPLETNLKKRLIKAPKVYIRDSGILHTLLEIENMDNLMGHPIFGASWEGFCIENILSSISNRWKASFYRTSSGNELDLILEKGKHRIALEFKASKAPIVTKGFWISLDELHILQGFIVAPVDSSYPLKENIQISTLKNTIQQLNRFG